ncbi:alpha/beta hydrolase [Corynebacterium qintianiae]|uniref:Alpha/beta hydrolase n=1 Tax=Corynebacterium qintianiae TaxID=2709392 RepID=A0A7T0KNC8_9CORY|nr:alpha/beta hydrolase [Corynebacterium qintianiae]QPK83335.1 alpha/beta hydrolase [Corynebacterium qintianiae]
MTPKLEQGSLDDDYPVNDQSDPDFNVGGVKRILPDELQFEQIVSYMEATYPRPSDPEDVDRYLALLPDRLTHAAMLMLGSAVDHTMPGVAYPKTVGVEDTEFGTLFRPARETGVWAVSYAPLGEKAREFAWQPEVAGAAELAGALIVDVDKPEALEPAIAYARAQGASEVAAWLLYENVPTTADRTILTFPDNTDDVSPNVLVQTPAEYHSTGEISTPAEARRRIRDTAQFLSAGPDR